MSLARLLFLHGAAIVAGVPGMVLLSVGSVVAVAGSAAAIIWPVSAIVGGSMALLFAGMVSRNANENGGFVVAAARVFEPRFRALSVLAQWSYWLGWAPTPAIYGATIAAYVHAALAPIVTFPVAVIIAFAVAASIFVLNLFPVIITARFQCIVAVSTIAVFLLLVAQPFWSEHVSFGGVLPLAPPGGWGTFSGIAAVLGGFFLAGWSAYGAEIGLTYLTDYRDGYPAAFRVVVVGVVLTVIAYTVFPLLLISTVDIATISGDPSTGLISWFDASNVKLAAIVVLVALVLSMFLAVNMTTLASSRLLGQMSRNGYCRIDLSKENRADRPWRALLFDFVANATLLMVIITTSHGDLSSIPSALLATANVGYFVAIILGLVGSASSERARGGSTLRVSLAIALAVANAFLLALAGIAWGWINIIMGVLILIAVTSLMSPLRSGVQSAALANAE